MGVPFSSLVEKAMESKGKELLPKIQEVITSLRQTKPLPTTSKDDKTKPKDGEHSVPSKSGVEFDLSLPIDLPGLGLSSYPSAPAKKPAGTHGSDGKGNRVKSKQVESGVKEVKGVGPRVKSQANDGKVETSAVRDGKGKEEETAKRVKASTDASTAREGKVREEGKEEPENCPLVAEVSVKETKRVTGKIRRVKEEVREKSATDKVKEKVLHEKVKALDEEPANEGRSRASSKESSNHGDSSNGKKSEQEVKQQPMRRRSARIASLSEDVKKNDTSDVESETVKEGHPKRQSPSAGADVQTKASMRQNPSAKTKVSSRKRARVWVNSSSEEQESEDEIYEERKPGHSKTVASKETKAGSVERNKIGIRKRRHESEMHGPVISLKRLCHTKSGSPLERQGTSDEPANTNKRKSRPPRKLSRASKSPIKSPSPIVTRFNRQVKPNRKYYDSSEEQEGSEEEGKGSEDETEQEAVNTSTSDNDVMS